MPPARAVLYITTAGVLALVVKAIAVRPPPLALSIGVLAGYVGLVVVGFVFTRLRMFVDLLCAGPPRAHGVALTFDDGPDPSHTPKVLESLAAARAKATFFVIGRKAEQHPDLIREIHKRGHALGVHGYAHDRWLSLRGAQTVRHDLQRAVRAIERITGSRPRLFRAPVGHASPVLAKVARGLGLQLVGWSVRGRDGRRGARAEQVLARVAPGLRDRAVVWLHDSAEHGDFEPAGVAALERILAVALRRQLDFVRLDDWAA